ncbi:MAG: phosphoribosylglycinamide formyltransferase [Armatimonadota bacterium]
MQLAVFVGTKGRGSNLMAIHGAMVDGRLPGRIVAVVGTDIGAPAMVRAEEAGLPVVVVPAKGRDAAAYAADLVRALRDAGADTIALAGYLRILPEAVVDEWRHRIVNIHPALLPSFGGKGMYGHHVHEAVLAYGAKVSGCTAHLVDREYDTGPVILQSTVVVEDDDTPESLAARLLPVEHATFVEALRLVAEGRVRVEGRRVRLEPRRPS